MGQGRVSVRMPEQEVDPPPPPPTLHLLTEREDGARQGDGELSGGKGKQSMQGITRCRIIKGVKTAHGRRDLATL